MSGLCVDRVHVHAASDADVGGSNSKTDGMELEEWVVCLLRMVLM